MVHSDQWPDVLQQLLEVPIDNDDEDKYISTNDDDPHANLILEAIKNDSLRRLERIKKHESEHCILTAAKLISPMIEDRWGHFETKLVQWCPDLVDCRDLVD